ncbi:hypothetical protein ACF0H5_002802 [Mactra antiquata]
MASINRHMSGFLPLIFLLVTFSLTESRLYEDSKTFEQHAYDKKTRCEIHELDVVSWNESGEKGYAMDCSDLCLNNTPKSYPALNETRPHLSPPLRLLNLSHNTFKSINNNSFVNVTNMNSSDVMWLYLYFCNITFIDSNAFVNLSSLLYLNLTGNNLVNLNSFGPGVFKPLISLVNINFYGNKFTTFEGLGTELKYLKNLCGLFIDLCENCTFGKGFEKLTNLKNLSLSRFTDNSCNSPTIYNDTFENVSMIERLYVGNCNVRKIEPGAFSPLKNLIHLDISYNEDLKFDGMNTALYGLRYSRTLKILNVNRIHSLYGLGVMLTKDNMENLKTLLVLEKLYMDINKIEIFQESVLYPENTLPKSLSFFALSGNRLSISNYTRHLKNVTSVKSLDISRQHLDYDPFLFEHFEHRNVLPAVHDSHNLDETFHCNCSAIGVICLPNNITSIKWRKSFLCLKIEKMPNNIPFMLICGATSLVQLDLSFNLITRWNGHILGLDNLNDLDLSENLCSEADPDFFKGFPNLRILNISGNSLGNAFTEQKASLLFQNLSKLNVLDMSCNKLKVVPDKMFEDISNITHLYVGGNLLTQWNSSLEKHRCLQMLDLADNKISRLEKETLNYLDSLTNESCYTNITVNLTNNPLDCACPNLYFLKWIRKSNILVRVYSDCSINAQKYAIRNRTDLDAIIDLLENEVCKVIDKSWITWMTSVVSVVCTGIITISACFLVHKHRWKLRYLYYSRHRRHVVEGYDRIFQYNAFICYARVCGGFLKRVVVPMLEATHGLVTWVYDKNSLPGISTAENITHAINNSKKCVLLVNREFLADSWCEYETNMALVESIITRRDMIIVVMMEPIPMLELPNYLQRLLLSARSLEYPDHGQDENTFWMNLADEINT